MVNERRHDQEVRVDQSRKVNQFGGSCEDGFKLKRMVKSS